MIKARRLEAWLMDWVHQNTELTMLTVDGEVMAYDGEEAVFSIRELAECLAVALAEEGLDRA